MDNADNSTGATLRLREPFDSQLKAILRDRAACVARIAPLTGFVPLATMSQCRVVPIAFERESRRLTVITDQPGTDDLCRQLAARLRGQTPEILQVPSQTIDTILDMISSAAFAPLTAVVDTPETSLSRDEAPTPDPVSIDYQQPELQFDEPGPESPHEQPKPGPEAREPLGTVLLVAPGAQVSPHLAFAWKAEGIGLETAGSIDDARQKVAAGTYDRICVHAELASGLSELISQVLRRSPGTGICIYESERDLLTGNVRDPLARHLADSHLTLARYRRLSSRDRVPTHQGEIADLVAEVAVACGIPDTLKELLRGAAYLHDLAADDIAHVGSYERADITRLSAGLLARWHYPQTLTDLLRWMAGGPPVDTGDIHWTLTTGACILRAVDELCHLCPDYRMASTAELRRVRERLIALTEVFTCPAVVDQLMKIVTGRRSCVTGEEAAFRVHVLWLGERQDLGLVEALGEAGYTVEESCSLRECAREYRRLRPRVLLIVCSGSTYGLSDHLLELALKGVRIDQTPTIMMLDHSQIGAASWCIRHGIEELLPVNTLPEAVVAKIERIKMRLRQDQEHRQSVISQLGTHGSLADMKLINLLEATRCGNRPMQISLTGEGRTFTIYVQGDRIIFAEGDTVSGHRAVAETLALTSGVWSVDPVNPEDIPEPNVDATIGSVLLEACYQHDKSELRRSSQDISELVT